jgi:hypothetical protein
MSLPVSPLAIITRNASKCIITYLRHVCHTQVGHQQTRTSNDRGQRQDSLCIHRLNHTGFQMSSKGSAKRLSTVLKSMAGPHQFTLPTKCQGLLSGTRSGI